MRNTVATSIRFDLNDEADRKAWEYLRQMGKKKYRTYSKAVIVAINDYFGKLEKLESDPYLETREKEDAFLQQVLETIKCGLQASAPANSITGLLSVLQGIQPQAASAEEPSQEQQDTVEAAVDFIDSF